MKIKRIIIFLLVLVLIPFTIKAEEKITKEALSNAYRDVLACNKEGNYTELKYETKNDDGSTSTTTYKECKATMDYSGINMADYITDDKIFADADDGSKIPINYTIQDNGDVLFYTTHTIDNTTTYEQYQQYTTDGLSIIIGYPIVAGAKGIQYKDSSAYMADMIMGFMFEQLEKALSSASGSNSASYVIVEDGVEYTGSGVAIKKSEFPAHAVEYAKAINGTNKTSLADNDKLDTFSLTITPDASDNTKYILTTELLVKASKDFSGINGLAEKSFINDSTAKQSADPVEETKANDDQPTAYNPKTGALLNMVPIIILFAIGILLVINNKSYFKKI